MRFEWKNYRNYLLECTVGYTYLRYVGGIIKGKIANWIKMTFSDPSTWYLFYDGSSSHWGASVFSSFHTIYLSSSGYLYCINTTAKTYFHSWKDLDFTHFTHSVIFSKHLVCLKSIFFGGGGDFFFVQYSALLHLPPLRFHCVDGCWDRTQNRYNWCIAWQSGALTLG
jgi:hypothetical protein